ncbi:hypothetical protein A3H77_00270 [Candidatus Kaiserbacteria bacterium RIFCSPLOWO2_02_FULL_56_11]|uniref:Uncharacterized protein n=2 Tax=Candidatus Kaiseribacteriota TaxID=1752734 RepID=A0A1F6E3Y2_9BACT|nr:MAG: hypothetical protein A3C95_01370 [Candidatus Kaiserbacteria bacterium RIFCSPHIGHO2_02_FULL_56_30]OGG72366.1 MAG: hypothetical protein A3E65_01540 [Candidatus Kaiserbacteria bacterium RIFCSPHIGHO2_12_FULL_56_13]OGG80838.1 MAG: hypothetical protein A3H77_00270 [Candidatus Kaiserbacteria bacterium RIFCSPLOWO2_02_FULL_56_11]
MSRFNDGYTGHLFEEEKLGRCNAPYRGHLRWKEAVEVVRKNQPRTKTPFVARLEREVSAQIGSPVAFFTAVRSALDEIHKVDGFFEFQGIVVTIDLTMDPNKDVCKADLLVDAEDVADVPTLAGRVARELRSRLVRRAA